MASYDRLADLPLIIEDYALEERRRVTPGFTRVTTTYHLRGAGEEGLGEDVGYWEDEQDAQLALGPVLALAGTWTVDSFSSHLDELDLWPAGPAKMAAARDYRRWGYESAAVDLALRQAGTTLHALLGREARPLRFGVSLRLGAPPSMAPVERRLAVDPGIRFKLDADPSWDDAFCRTAAATGAVDVIDLKGAYKGTVVDVETDAGLYARLAEVFPDVWLEDPDLEPADAREALAPHMDRVTWDAPIHSVADVDALSHAPRCLNCKPSRFGTWRRLLDFYDACEQRGIALYGGGQSELGVGRGQIQLLAAIFHPDGPNDVAPSGHDWAEPPPGLPTSPLDPAPEPAGFRRRA
jgi:hypothetical protein